MAEAGAKKGNEKGSGDALSGRAVRAFRRKVLSWYREHGRAFAWRATTDPYAVLVSEIMLQQTRTERVEEKYAQFLSAFPDFPSLDRAALHEVLKVWQGMGYNRRALALKEIARRVVREQGGALPATEEELRRLPGIGKYTASAVMVFAFNRPAVFIETNVRTVFLHFFFPDRAGVHDRELVPLVERTLDRRDPRTWYYALMDYGVMLKRSLENPGRRSVHHKKQAPFRGSNRQVRGMILKALVEQPGLSEEEVAARVPAAPEALRENLRALQTEGFIVKRGRTLRIAS
ncbi:MAG: hypothetical protein U0411_15465 [Thermodesulfovibrionales bacterium]